MNITFRDLESGDVKYFFEWLKDESVTKYSLSKFQNMKSDSQISEWFDEVLSENSSYKKAIVDSDKNNLIGYAGISGISNINKSGEYFIFIGDESYHGKGVGTFVTKEIVKIGFEDLGLNRIMLTVSDINVGALRAYTKANFKTEGIMRQACFRDGKFHNKIVMSILREEWISLTGK